MIDERDFIAEQAPQRTDPVTTPAAISQRIAVEILGWTPHRGSYWKDVGCPIGSIASFDPATREEQAQTLATYCNVPYTAPPLEFCESLLTRFTERQKKRLQWYQGTCITEEEKAKYPPPDKALWTDNEYRWYEWTGCKPEKIHD